MIIENFKTQHISLKKLMGILGFVDIKQLGQTIVYTGLFNNTKYLCYYNSSQRKFVIGELPSIYSITLLDFIKDNIEITDKMYIELQKLIIEYC